MEFVEIEKEEYSTFARKHPLRNFFQTTEMEILSNYSGWKSDYVGVKENGKLVAATRMVSYKNRLGYYYFYAPRGLLADYKNKEQIAFFTKKLKQYLKKKKGYVLRIDPTLIHLSRDADGNVVEGKENNEDCVETLKKCGYKHQGYVKGYLPDSQNRWVYCLDLKNKTEEEILNEMKASTRNKIKKISKYGLRIRELTKEELPIFKDITEEASKRNHFMDKDLLYYERMYDIFKPKNGVKYLIAELDTKAYLEGLEKELEEAETTLKGLDDHYKNAGKKKELNVSIESTKKKIERMKEINKQGEIIPIAAAMFLLYEDEIIYYHSGNYKEYYDFGGQIMIQWYMIKYGIENHFRRHNFLGISGNFQVTDADSGVYEFKKGFGGYVEEYIGDFDLPINFYYYVKKLFK